MSNIPHMAATLEKRPGKVESFETIKKLASGKQITDSELAGLYAYFLPTKPNKITDVFTWVSQPCDAKSSFAFCRFVESSGDQLRAANPKIMHLTLSGIGGQFPDGWYDTERGPVGSDIAIMPDINKAYLMSIHEIFEPLDLSKLKVSESPIGLVYVLPNGGGVPKQYADTSLASLKDAILSYSDDPKKPISVHGSIKDTAVCAVILPGRVL